MKKDLQAVSKFSHVRTHEAEFNSRLPWDKRLRKHQDVNLSAEKKINGDNKEFFLFILEPNDAIEDQELGAMGRD